MSAEPRAFHAAWKAFCLRFCSVARALDLQSLAEPTSLALCFIQNSGGLCSSRTMFLIPAIR